MKLTINNIGKLKNAEVEINGITVIAGENNTGKSTVGKVLWSIFNSFYNISAKILDKKEEEIMRILSEENIFNDKELRTITKKIIEEKQLKKLKKNLKINKEDFNSIEKKINNTLSDNKSDKEKIILNKLNDEFEYQVKNIFTKNKKSKILLKIKDKDEINMEISENGLKILSSFDIKEQVAFIDDPYILDEIGIFSIKTIEASHRIDLKENLKIEKIDNIYTQKNIEEELNVILKKLDDVFDGDLTNDTFTEEFFYVQNNTDEGINIKNLSTGLKSFAIIKILLQNGFLKKRGTIIFDEPEIHLHPEWQIKFAELIVLLQKEFGMHILLTTHSPYFLKAIQVYSKKYEIENKCKYYMSETIGKSSILVDKTNKLQDIFYKLTIPFEDLMNEEDLL
mgnify:CR=1 FL=1